MSIVTRTGDKGDTGLMYNRRVPKCHPRVEAYGAVDELNSALGLARASAEAPLVRDNLLAIQKDLVLLMGELATLVEDLPRYRKDGYSVVTPGMRLRLEKLIQELETLKLAKEKETPKTAKDGWATPGASLPSATLDLARTTCRRAERRVCALEQAGQLQNPEIIIYLNRLSDLLWLLARSAESGRDP